MPIYQLGDLVRPWSSDPTDALVVDAIGLIVEMRSATKPEAKILWSDLPGREPIWMWLSDVLPLGETR